MLYFVVADLATIDVMYQFSLSWFRQLFVSCIETAAAGGGSEAPPGGLTAHLQTLIGRLTRSLYRVVCVAMAARHQLTLSFLLTAAILRSNDRDPTSDLSDLGRVSELEWNVLLQADLLASLSSEKRKAGESDASPTRVRHESDTSPTRVRCESDASLTRVRRESDASPTRV